MDTPEHNTENNNKTDNNKTDNTENDNTEALPNGRPLGAWLRAVDGLISQAFADALQHEGVSRREWMALNVLSGDVQASALSERLARKGKALRRLESRGWATEAGDGSWSLSDSGRAAHTRLATLVEGIRSRVTGAVSPEDYAAMIASLEAIATELGGAEEASPAFGGRGGHRFFGRGHGPERARRGGPRGCGGDERLHERHHDRRHERRHEQGHDADTSGRGDHAHVSGHGHGKHERGRGCAYGNHGHRDCEHHRSERRRQRCDHRRRHGGPRGKRSPRIDVHIHVHPAAAAPLP